MRQQHMGVAIEQPIIPNMNFLAGWNMYRIRMPFAINQLTGDLVGGANNATRMFDADATSKAFNKNQVFIMGLEYKVTT